MKMRNLSAYHNWIRRKLRMKPVQINNMQFGSVYTFAYDAPKGNDMDEDDFMPLIIIYMSRNGGYLGLNLFGMERDIRKKILKAYEEAADKLAAGNNKEMLTLMESLKRNTYSKRFMKFYKKSGFKARPVEVTLEDLEELGKKAF